MDIEEKRRKHKEYMRKWYSEREIKQCSLCLKTRKIYFSKKNLCFYCGTRKYVLKYHKEHREIYRRRLNRWRETTGKKSLVYAHKYNYGGNRELAIQRDGEKCIKCGITRQEHKKKIGKDLAVDHINGKGMYDIYGGRRNSLHLEKYKEE